MPFIENLQKKPLENPKKYFAITLFLFGILLVGLFVMTIASVLPNIKSAGKAWSMLVTHTK